MRWRRFGSWQNLRLGLDVIATLAMIVAAGFLVSERWPKSRPAQRVPAQPMALDDVAVLGADTARVAVIEFSDFECPYCGQFARNTLSNLKSEFVDKGVIRFAFRHLPLESLHKTAFRAAEASECSRRQGAFWKMHDRLFSDPKKTRNDVDFLTDAAAIGLDGNRFSACMQGEAASVVRQSAKDASALGISSTPTFLIGRIRDDGRVQVTSRLSGTASPTAFADAITKAMSVSSQGWIVTAFLLVVAGVFSVILARKYRLLFPRESIPPEGSSHVR